ncbi:unnamed protein product, partial [Adineta steineri]
DLRVKVARLVSCKVTLAARVDSFHESRQDQQRKILLSDIERRIEKLEEPPPVKAVKPLPRPAVYILIYFYFFKIEEDAYQDAVGFSTGMLGKSGSGKVRAAQFDPKTKAKISQKLQVCFLLIHFINLVFVSKSLQGQNNAYGGTTTVHNRKQTSVTASSVAFTPLQGLEIVNPNAADKDKTGIESQKYFS